MVHKIMTACIVVVTARLAIAGPINDDCAHAIPIEGEGVFTFDNQGATMDGVDACNGVDSDEAIDHDVWFCWTPDRFTDVTIDTCAQTTVDTKIAVYLECECDPFPTHAEDCNDDACHPVMGPCPVGACGFQSLVTFQAYEGESYLIRIGTSPTINAEPGGGRGTFSIEYGLPADLPCAETQAYCQPSDEWNALASGNGGLVVADDFSPSQDGFITGLCWWGGYYDGQADCHVGTEDSFEVRYYLNDGRVPGPLIAGPFRSKNFSLDVSPRAKSGQRLLEVTAEFEYSATHEPVPVLAGEIYWIEIRNERSGDCAWYWSAGRGGNDRSLQGASASGFGESDILGADLAFCLSLPLGPISSTLPVPESDECDTAVPLFDGHTPFDTSAATNSDPQPYPCFPPEPWCLDFPLGDEDVHKDIWFDYVPTCSGTLTVGLCDSAFDTKLAIYDGSGCPPHTAVLAWNDDDCAPKGYPVPQPLESGHQAHDENAASVSGVEVESDCYEPHLGRGCDDEECETLVCTADPFCCLTSWYNTCAARAIAYCRDTVGDGLQSEVEVRVMKDISYKVRVGGFRGASGAGTINLSMGPADPTAQTLEADFAEFSRCLIGPLQSPSGLLKNGLEPCCPLQDYDADGDADLRDFALFSRNIEKSP